jgi:hypothetical protein
MLSRPALRAGAPLRPRATTLPLSSPSIRLSSAASRVYPVLHSDSPGLGEQFNTSPKFFAGGLLRGGGSGTSVVKGLPRR